TGEIVGGRIFAAGDGGQGAVSLLNGQALWNMCHLTAPKAADYKERVSPYFDHAVLELEFPSPWLNHQPTRVSVKTSEGQLWRQTELRNGFEGAFVRELAAFHAACVESGPVRNTVEHARRDQALLCGLARHHARAMGGR